MRRTIKTLVKAVPGGESTVASYWKLKKARAARRLRQQCYAADIREGDAYLNWTRTGGDDYWKISSELIFQHHKLEKGMCLPAGARAWFGRTAALETLRLLEEWRGRGFGSESPVYQSSLEILRAYRARIAAVEDRNAERLDLVARIDASLGASEANPAFATPIASQRPPAGAAEALGALALSRRSTRDFTAEPVDMDLIARAVEIAQLSPSACNRQPWKLHLYDDPDDIRNMLALQNGNSGFGHTVPMLGVMSADLGSFFDASERIEPILDGGLFLMSLLLGLQAQGLASCCLNWCVDPARDAKAHEIGGIPMQHKILTFLAIGHPNPDAIVPLSGRRPMSDVIHKH